MQIYWKKIGKMKQLLKILIGAAWIDGVIQPEERKYFHRIASDFQLAEDPEIKTLLAELKPIKSEECYQWLEDYLGKNPTQADYQELFEKISGLIYSDGDVDVREVKLIEKLQLLDPTNQPRKSAFDKVLKKIQKLYQQAVHEQA
ncbi:hypothetical protein Sta7437_1568 [Stanieria cyanosphaera PCC 7437]|uniref:Co-chaperone DjlA N-terminal domain-containing protein n=1 Tax=Stanieria cyanosphaera (strain ATCC 29371 / PCC 7437) TaxID=111780 RepID=K9XR95_STAC7|nr:TerB family tellurite resistance protein [Stanieria cyanosphaera]AFZ35135.1 hypothetical protein Sta7437_1568 [Stanieria cyanosphaera PCC 7437]